MSAAAAGTAGFLGVVRDLLSDETRWCKGTHAIDAEGVPVSALGLDARAWCVDGAAYRTSKDLGVASGIFKEGIYALDRASRLTSGVSTWEFNDNARTSHSDVLALIDKAIGLCK